MEGMISGGYLALPQPLLEREVSVQALLFMVARFAINRW